MRLYFFILAVVLLTSCSAAQPATLTVATSIPPTELLSPPNPSPTFPPAYDPIFERAQCFTADLRGSLPDSGYDLECGFLIVPEDRSQPEGRLVTVHPRGAVTGGHTAQEQRRQPGLPDRENPEGTR